MSQLQPAGSVEYLSHISDFEVVISLTDTGENVQKWTRLFSTQRWVILVARTRRKKEKKIACPVLDVLACGQVSSPRLYRLTIFSTKFEKKIIHRPGLLAAVMDGKERYHCFEDKDTLTIGKIHVWPNMVPSGNMSDPTAWGLKFLFRFRGSSWCW